MPRSQSQGIETLVDDSDRERIYDLNLLDRFKVGETRRNVLRIHNGLIGELHITAFEEVTIVKSHIRP